MAKTFLTNINLKGNQLLNAVIHSASSAPAALAAGQLYFNTGDNTFYYSIGTGTGNWEPVGIQYISSVGSNLSVTDGELNISTDPSFNTISLTQDGQGENILVGNDAYIGDVNVSNFIGIKGNEDGTKGGIKFGSGLTETISSDASNLTLTSSNDIILLPGSDHAYLGTPLIDGSNRIATLGDVLGDLTGYVTETGVETLTNKTLESVKITGPTSFNDAFATQYLSISRSGTGTARITAADDLALRATNDVIIYPGNDVSGHTGKVYIHWGDDNWNAYPDREIATLGSIQGTTNQINIDRSNSKATISIAPITYIENTAAKYATIILDADNQFIALNDANTDNRILTISTSSNNANIDAASNHLNLSSSYGDVNLYPDSNVVNIGSGYGELHLQKTEYWRGGTQQGIIAAQSDGSLKITGNNDKLELESNNGNVNITSFNSDIQLNADGQVIISNGTNLHVGNNIYVKNGIYAGGSDTTTDGYVRIQDLHGNNVFTISADGTSQGATAEIHGNFNFYQPLTGTMGVQYGSINVDGDSNLVINANNNNLILQSDNNNSVYLGSVVGDNKVATIGDLNSVQSGLTWKQAVNVKIDEAEAASLDIFVTGEPGSELLTSGIIDGVLQIDGHNILNSDSGYRILVTGTNSTKDGIWSVNAVALNNWTASRTADANTFAELKGAAVFVMEGTKYAATSWVQNNHYITDFIGQTWAQFSGQGTYIGSNAILINGREISVILDSDSLAITSSGLKVNPSTTGGLDIDGGLYVRTGAGLKIDSNNVQVDYTSLESQLVTDDFAKNADYSTVTRKYSTEITPVTPFDNTSFVITHNLNTLDNIVRVYQTFGMDSGADVEVDIKRTSSNIVSISFAAAPADGETYKVVVIG